MEKTMLLNVILGLMLLVTGMQAFQLNTLNSAYVKFPSTQASTQQISTGSALSALPQGNSQADAEYEKMMDEMHPGWREQQGIAPKPAGGAAAPQTGAQQAPAINAIANLPNMVGGC